MAKEIKLSRPGNPELAKGAVHIETDRVEFSFFETSPGQPLVVDLPHIADDPVALLLFAQLQAQATIDYRLQVLNQGIAGLLHLHREAMTRATVDRPTPASTMREALAAMKELGIDLPIGRKTD